MKPLLKYFVIAIAAMIGIVILSSCGTSNATVVVPGGNIKGSFFWQTLGTTPSACTVPAITWTANSATGSSLTFTSAATTTESICKEYNDIEAGKVTKCYCGPISVDFMSVIPDKWTIDAAWTPPPPIGFSKAHCEVTVQSGQTTTFNQYTDFISCTNQ